MSVKELLDTINKNMQELNKALADHVEREERRAHYKYIYELIKEMKLIIPDHVTPTFMHHVNAVEKVLKKYKWCCLVHYLDYAFEELLYDAPNKHSYEYVFDEAIVKELSDRAEIE